MKEATLYEFCLFFTTYELKVSETQISLKPESAHIAIESLNVIKDLPCSLILLFLRKGQELESTQIAVARHILVGTNTLFQS